MARMVHTCYVVSASWHLIVGFVHFLRNVAANIDSFASLLTALAVWKGISVWWRRTMGRRRNWRALYAQLAIGVRIERVIDLFGQPPYKRNLTSGVEWTWELATDGYLQVLTDEGGVVTRYALTSTSRRFRPRIRIGAVGMNDSAFEVRLGKTRFSEIPMENVEAIQYFVGETAPSIYTEEYYFGRSGGYLPWVCAYNATGIGDFAYQPEAPVQPSATPYGMFRDWLNGLSGDDRVKLDSLRRATTVNTVSVGNDPSDVPASKERELYVGPDREVIRLRAGSARGAAAALRSLTRRLRGRFAGSKAIDSSVQKRLALTDRNQGANRGWTAAQPRSEPLPTGHTEEAPARATAGQRLRNSRSDTR
jgi:hypothetical protein